MTRTNILITGASSGLGRGMALEFAKMGRNLALCARRIDRVEALRDELLAINPNIKVFVRALDVDNHEQVFHPATVQAQITATPASATCRFSGACRCGVYLQD